MDVTIVASANPGPPDFDNDDEVGIPVGNRARSTPDSLSDRLTFQLAIERLLSGYRDILFSFLASMLNCIYNHNAERFQLSHCVILLVGFSCRIFSLGGGGCSRGYLLLLCNQTTVTV